MRDVIIPLYNSSDKLIEKSVGCYQYDSDGKEFIDFESGVWCANLGHGNKKILEIIEKQSKKSIHHGYRFRNQFSEKLSVELQRLMGFENGASVFLSSGSEAVNLSITIAQNLTGRKKILKIDNSYLSAYGFGQIKSNNEYLVNAKYNDSKALEKIDFDNIAAFVMETGGASVEMVRFPNVDFIQRLIELVKSNNCLIIAEEVTTGIGRLGKWFGFQHYNIEPEIVVTGKALGNGYPISAVTIDSVVKDRFEKDSFIYAQSHQNDPFGCAIGLEVLKEIEQNNLIEQCEKIGDYFKDQLLYLQKKHPDKIKEVRAKGLMLAVEFKETFNGQKVSNELFEYGFVIGFKINTLRFLPPLIIKQKEIDKLISKLVELLT